MCLVNSAMSSHLASHPVHLQTPVSEQLMSRMCGVGETRTIDNFYKLDYRTIDVKNVRNENYRLSQTLTVERVLIQVGGDASVLVLLVGVVVVRDVHVAIFNLFLFPPGLNNNIEFLFQASGS